MSIGDAQRFLKSVPVDEVLRDGLNRAKSHGEIFSRLKEASFGFSYAEIEEAYTTLLVQCQSEESARHLIEVKSWWDLLLVYTPQKFEMIE